MRGFEQRHHEMVFRFMAPGIEQHRQGNHSRGGDSLRLYEIPQVMQVFGLAATPAAKQANGERRLLVTVVVEACEVDAQASVQGIGKGLAVMQTVQGGGVVHVGT